MNIITNNVPRDVIHGYELSADERAEFDYIDWDAVERGETSPEFVRYKGDLIDLGDLEYPGNLPADHPFHQWSGYQSDSFFSGLLVRYVDDQFETVVVGRYYS